MKKKLPRSICKYIRLQKARIHRGILDVKKQKELIDELYQKIIRTSPPARTLKAKVYSKEDENTRNLQPSNK